MRPMNNGAGRPAVQHFLLTIMIAADASLHAYARCTSKRRAFDVGEWLAREAERLGSRHTTVLITPLPPDDADRVRRIASARNDEVREALQTVTDFQVATWTTRATQAEHHVLLELH